LPLCLKEHAVATGLAFRGLWLSHPLAISYVHYTLFRWRHERLDWAPAANATSSGDADADAAQRRNAGASVGEQSFREGQGGGSAAAAAAAAAAAVAADATEARAAALAKEPRCGGTQPLCLWAGHQGRLGHLERKAGVQRPGD
jgi:hypothetical protein